jgi:hypothetical protein
VYIRDQAPEGSGWLPFPSDVSLPDQVDDALRGRGLSIHHARLSIGSPNFEDEVLTLLLDATRDQATPILFIDPAVLRVPATHSLLASLALKPWIGGMVIPGAASDVVTRLVQDDLALPLERSEQIVVRSDVASASAFAVAVVSVVDDILARISRFGTVQNSPQANDGPSTRPRISNA